MQHFDHGSARQARDIGNLGQGKGNDRQNLVLDFAVSPSCGRQDRKIQSKNKRQQRRHDKVRDGDADHGNSHHGKINRTVLSKGGIGAKPDPKHKGQGNRT